MTCMDYDFEQQETFDAELFCRLENSNVDLPFDVTTPAKKSVNLTQRYGTNFPFNGKKLSFAY